MDCSNILTNNWIVGPVIFSSHQFLGKLVFEMVIQSHVERNVFLCPEHWQISILQTTVILYKKKMRKVEIKNELKKL